MYGFFTALYSYCAGCVDFVIIHTNKTGCSLAVWDKHNQQTMSLLGYRLADPLALNVVCRIHRGAP